MRYLYIRLFRPSRISNWCWYCVLIFSQLLIFHTAFVSATSLAAEAYPVEVTHKIIIIPPQCPKGQEYDKVSDKCVGPGLGPGPPSNPRRQPGNPGIINPTSNLPFNFTEVETEVGGKKIPYQQIVIVNGDTAKDIISLKNTTDVLTKIVKDSGAEVIYRYNNAIIGFAFKAPNQQVADKIVGILSHDPRVKFVEQDQTVVPFSEQIPTGLQRIDANGIYSIPKIESFRANIDIAIIDSGIDLDNPDLNVYSNVSAIVPQVLRPSAGDEDSIVNNDINLDNIGLNIFAPGSNHTAFYPPFTTKVSSTGDDTCGHGTHVAGIAAAKVDLHGIVGIAPDARLWAIKVLEYDKIAKKCVGSISSVVAAVEYVTKHKDQIDIVNLSLGCKCNSTALDDAIVRSVKSNVTYVVAAGNVNSNASAFSPANNKDVITVSAIADTDGKCGGVKKPIWVKAGQYSGLYDDDTFAKFSNYGSVIDIAAPGVNVNSTGVNGTYSTMGGTSIAAPHVAGAAALYKLLNPSATPSEIHDNLVKSGLPIPVRCDGLNHGYFGRDTDSVHEPLLYIDGLVKKFKEKFSSIGIS
jgi:subtilisin